MREPSLSPSRPAGRRLRAAGPMAARCGALLAGLGLATGCGPGGEEPPRPRSAILISIDTLRADHLGCYGQARATSPGLDALAARGTLFEEASSTAPWTLPAHVSMFTGLYPSSHGVDGTKKELPADVPLLAEQLAGSGFATGGFYNAMLGPQRGFSRGFDVWQGIPKAEAPEGATAQVVEAGLAWVSAQGGRPFFLFLHLYDVHSDYEALPDYEARFVGPYQGPADGTTAQLNRYRAGELSGWGAPEAGHLAALYDAGIRQLDDQLQALWQGLAERGLMDETLIVLTSDHGEEFLERGGVLHDDSLHEEQVHVPLLLLGPGVPAGGRVPGPVSLIDLAPTILALLGAPALPGLQGVDLSRAWREPGEWPPRRPIFAEADRWYAMEPGNLRRSVRVGRYKLHYDKATGARRLYDLQADPGERTDLAAEKPKVAETLWAELERFMAGGRELEESLELSDEERAALEALGYF